MKKWVTDSAVLEVVLIGALLLASRWSARAVLVICALWLVLRLYWGLSYILFSDGRASAREPEATRQEPDSLFALVGRSALTVSTLRPMGTVEIDGMQYEARSLHGLIGPREPVQVTQIDHGALVVETNKKLGAEHQDALDGSAARRRQ